MSSEVKAATIPIIEVFGPVLQGEGALIGRQTHFVRVGGCDYRCSWCDTLDAVLPERVAALATRMASSEIVEAVKMLPGSPTWVTLSGGNPAIFNLEDVVTSLRRTGYQVAVETQGSICPEWFRFCNLITVSPKPPSSGMVPKLRMSPLRAIAALNCANIKVVLKVPIADLVDLEWAKTMFSQFTYLEHYVQPVRSPGVDNPSEQLVHLNELAKAVMKDSSLSNVVVLPQLHALLGMR